MSSGGRRIREDRSEPPLCDTVEIRQEYGARRARSGAWSKNGVTVVETSVALRLRPGCTPVLAARGAGKLP
jgi:hypothetical protein